jgi:CDP-glucose 4,6-dehydratase
VPSNSVLVTGGHGFVGSWLCRRLLERGERVVALDLAAREGRPSGLALLGVEDGVAEIQGDLTDPGLLRRALQDHGVKTVFHLAAKTIVQDAAESPALAFEVNVRGTWLLLEACRERGVEGVVVASSDKAYGAHDRLPYREDFALMPTAPYEASKAAADLIARAYWHSYGLPVAVTRFANVYGGGDTNFSRLIPEAVSAALDGRPPVLRSDGSPERDFLYVEDATRAYVDVADALARDEVRGAAFNAGGGASHAVGDVVRMIARLAETDVEPDIRGIGNPKGEIDRQYVDPAKIRDLVGWRPEVALEDGLQRTIEWYRRHPEIRAHGNGELRSS